jgi:hypothetical protein
MNTVLQETPVSSDTPSKAIWDLRTWRGATLAVLSLRVFYAVWALFVSSQFPDTTLEKQVAVWPPTSLGTWLQRIFVMPWMRYDYEYYASIITHGYRTDDGTASFHPLYPLLAKALALLTGNALLSLLLVSTVATIVSCLLLVRYVERFHPQVSPTLTAWLFLLMPPGFMLLAPYTESTFFVFSIACLWNINLRRWWLAGLCGALATLTRQQGLALLLPFAWQFVVALRQKEARPHHALALLLLPLGYSLYSLYRILILGEMPSFEQGLVKYLAGLLVSPSSELVVPGAGLAAPWRPVIETWQGVFSTSNPYHLLIDFFLGWFYVLWLGFHARKLQPTEQLYGAAITILALCFYSPIYMSFPRHMILAFPLYIPLASWVARQKNPRLTVQIVAIFNVLLLCAFVRHGWVP